MMDTFKIGSSNSCIWCASWRSQCAEY